MAAMSLSCLPCGPDQTPSADLWSVGQAVTETLTVEAQLPHT